MRRLTIVIATVFSASGALADDCEGLGLESAMLTNYFCLALEDVIETPSTTRTLRPGDFPDDIEGGLEGPTGIEVIDRAYRADPRKTLELIKRIKGAGGLADQTN